MADRPYSVLSCGVSLDGYLDNAYRSRLILSNDADLDRMDAMRASCDAIMGGATTLRDVNPRLLVKSPERRPERVATGRTSSPMKVTVTRSGR
jgi:5-amino-6-(5-phosphoribosylamino)uracil reductase